MTLQHNSTVQLSHKLSNESEVMIDAPQEVVTRIKVMDESVEQTSRVKINTAKDYTSLHFLDSKNSVESLAATMSGREDATQSKLKLDLSNISYLKPHIVNPKTYNLAH